MLKFQIASDLHLETYDEIKLNEFIKPEAPILILAGDIGRIQKLEQLTLFLKAVCSKFKHVIYVLGNHEFYKVDGVKPKHINELIQDINSIQITNLHILNRSSLIIGDVCIIGCTLWSKIDYDVPKFIVRIFGMNRSQYNKYHKKDLKYIQKMIDYCNDKKLKLVVVSHHTPSILVCDKKDRYQTLYYSELDYLLEKSKVHTWICGHVHKNFDFITRKGTRLVSNQKGKMSNPIKEYSLTKIILI